MPQQKDSENHRKDHTSERHNYICPECGSTPVRRSRRTFWERLILSFSEIRPYNCSMCKAKFYAKSRRLKHE